MKRIANKYKSPDEILEILSSIASGELFLAEAMEKHKVSRRTVINWFRRYKPHLEAYLTQKKEQRANQIALQSLKLLSRCPPGL